MNASGAFKNMGNDHQIYKRQHNTKGKRVQASEIKTDDSNGDDSDAADMQSRK